MIYNILTYLENAVALYPEKTAFADKTEAITYSELWQRVCNHGSAISCRLNEKNVPVAVCINHNVNDIVNFLSIVYSGNFYVPIDMSLPQDRIFDMLNTLSPAAIISDNFIYDTHIPVLSNDDLSKKNDTLAPRYKECKDTDILYVIFTSGSTGVPKGVAVSHRSVIDMAEQFCDTFTFTSDCIFGNQAPFDFDVSVKDIYISLKLGATVEILEKQLFSFPKILIECLNERMINTIIWAVPALKIISMLNAFKNIKPEYLKNIMFSGEIMPPKTLIYWMQKLPTARFVNLYGPTEITCNCTYHIINDVIEQDCAIPIGVSFANCSVFLLDEDNAVPDGECGEICVGGSCLALGYYNSPDQTKNAFVQNPLNSHLPELIYRTGDIGVYKNGVLYYMGRKDTQIKHMGHRIEMSEIELCANSASGVQVSACVYDASASKIILFYTGSATKDELFLHIKHKLPKYMLPNICIQLESFPQNRTGKIDRKQLLTIAKKGEINYGKII